MAKRYRSTPTAQPWEERTGVNKATAYSVCSSASRRPYPPGTNPANLAGPPQNTRPRTERSGSIAGSAAASGRDVLSPTRAPDRTTAGSADRRILRSSSMVQQPSFTLFWRITDVANTVWYGLIVPVCDSLIMTITVDDEERRG
jgi:hypothetical protein